MPDARQPRARVCLGGEDVPGWTSWEVENNVFRAADTFRVDFAIAGLPAAKGVDWMSAQTAIELEIFAHPNPQDPTAYAPADADRVILGAVDDIDFNPVARTVTLTGRDLTARLIDTKTSEHFTNQTASQIAATLAARHGLTPVVTATTAKVGTYYTNDHTDLSQQQSEWELLCRLADYEDFLVYVRGRELHFEPRPDPTTKRYPVKWQPPGAGTIYPQADLIDLDFTRSLTIVKGLKVEVRTWNAKAKKAFNVTWPKGATASRPGTTGINADSAQVYRYVIGGLTRDQALARAQKIYAQIASHAMKVTTRLPADNVLDCTFALDVTGTGTGWDQVYFPVSVKRSMSFGEGYLMVVEAKNISPELDVT